MRLVHYQKTKRKYFQLNYWYNNKSNPLTLGEFIPGKFGVRECQTKIFEIVKEHTNDRGIWIRDPKQTIKYADKKVYDAEAIKLKKRSIREVIELIVKKNFPSNINDGSVVATTIKQLSLSMYGYNKRTLLMYYSDDNKGHGRIHFKGNKYYGIGKPENAEDLFKKFPPNHGIIETKKLSKYKNRLDEISLYDHDLSKNLI